MSLPRLHTGGGQRPTDARLHTGAVRRPDDGFFGSHLDGPRRRPPERYDDGPTAPRMGPIAEVSPLMPGLNPALQPVMGGNWRQSQDWSSPQLAGSVSSGACRDPQATPSRRNMASMLGMPVDDAKLQGCLNILQQLAGAIQPPLGLAASSPEVDLRRTGGFQHRGPGVRQSASLPSLHQQQEATSREQVDAVRQSAPVNPWAAPWQPSSQQEYVRGQTPLKRAEQVVQEQKPPWAAPWQPRDVADRVLGSVTMDAPQKRSAPSQVPEPSAYPNSPDGQFSLDLGNQSSNQKTRRTNEDAAGDVQAAQSQALRQRQASAQAAMAEVEAQAQALAMAHAEMQAQVEAQSQALAKAQAEAIAQAEALARAQQKAEAHAKAQAQVEAQAEAFVQAQAMAQASAQAHANAQAQMQLQAQALVSAQANADATDNSARGAHADATQPAVSCRGEKDGMQNFDVKPFGSQQQQQLQLQQQQLQQLQQQLQQQRAPLSPMRKNAEASVPFFAPFAANMQPLGAGNDRQPVSPLIRGMQKPESSMWMPELSFPLLTRRMG